MQDWLTSSPETLENLYSTVRPSSWVSMLLLAFCAAFLLPRQFHMIFFENRSTSHLNTASWALPLYLLLLNIPIIPIYLAGQALDLGSISADYTVLGVTQAASPAWVSLFVFLGGVSSASAMVIVTTLALASMFQNYFIMPARLKLFSTDSDLYRILVLGRRALISAIILSAYVFTILLENSKALVQLGLISFVAVAQLLPGIIGLLFWPRATGHGFVAGLISGAVVWFLLTVLPVIDPSMDVFASAAMQSDLWGNATFWTLFVNSCVYIGVSLATLPDLEQSEAADICVDERSYNASEQRVTAASPQQFKSLLSSFIGETSADVEVNRALTELDLDMSEQRPAKLIMLRDRIQRNLSTLVGPVLAKLVVDDRIQVEDSTRTALSDSVLFFERRIAKSQTELKGLAADLDRLRRYQKALLEVMPIGVCAIDANGQISLWNQALADITGLSRQQVEGDVLARLPRQWHKLLIGDASQKGPQRQLLQVGEHGETTLKISRASVMEDQSSWGNVILVEDRSDWAKLEGELAHHQRLASLGQLAAGVAHEIGNPLTGIASLSQLLKADSQQPEDIETIEEILRQTARIDSIVKSLLSMSHSNLEPGLETEALAVEDLIHQAVELTRLGSSGAQPNIELGDIAPVRIRGDEARLVQALINLLENALAASPQGQVVSISASQASEGVCIEVRDQGQGIDDAIAEKIFDPFFTTKPAGEGTGLGLALVLRTVQIHGGSLKLAANDPSGAIFSIYLGGIDAD